MAKEENTGLFVDGIVVRDFIITFTDLRTIRGTELLAKARKKHPKCYLDLSTYEEDTHTHEDGSVHTEPNYARPYLVLDTVIEVEEGASSWAQTETKLIMRSSVMTVDIEHTAYEAEAIKEEVEKWK